MVLRRLEWLFMLTSLPLPSRHIVRYKLGELQMNFGRKKGTDVIGRAVPVKPRVEPLKDDLQFP